MSSILPMPMEACERCIFHMLKDKKTTTYEIAFPYSLAIVAHDVGGEFKPINRAITKRWSPHALDRIKTLAWAILNSKDVAMKFRVDLNASEGQGDTE